MKHILSIFCVLIFQVNLSAQTYDAFYGGIVANTSSTNVLNDLTAFENFGVKSVGSTALTSTQNWITARYQSLGYTDVVLQPFTYSAGTSNNIIITKTGTVYPNTFLIIDAHYDTLNGPGTNDNGTGTVLLLELARLLKDVQTEYSIKFIHFSGEEDGLIGSTYYVNNTVNPQNLDIKLVFNIDEVGGVSGMTNNTIVCEEDRSNPTSNNAASSAATASLATCMELYSNLNTEISFAFASDYVPFENNGEIITGLYEKNVSLANHTANDLLVNMDPDYAYEVIKGSLGAALYFSNAYEPLSVDDEQILGASISIYPNPANNLINVTFRTSLSNPVEFKLVDLIGKEILKHTLSQQTQQVSVDALASGTYLAVFTVDGQQLVKKVILN